MRELNRAYAVLRTAEARRAYDQERRSPTVLTPVRHAPPPPATIDPWRRSRRVEEADAAAPAVLDFGRYAGWRLADLARHDADYLRWLSRHSSGIRYREQIASLLPNEPDMTRRANSVA
jgi:curved DNA-binding protein CbpA